ncbi:MAG: cytochrome c [Myxococcales bacterium]|nr:cytochrome c [Myxococcales bacterium]
MRWESSLLSRSVLLACVAGAWGCSKEAAAERRPDGAALFASTCARCHGPEGKGGPPLGPGQPGPRDLTDTAFHAVRTDKELYAVIRDGKGGVMPAFGAVYSHEQLEALVLHLRRLGGK